MSFMSSRQMARILKLQDDCGPLPGSKSKELVMHYLDTIAAKDDRRIMWVLESAADACADEIVKLEEELVRHTAMNRTDEARRVGEHMNRLQEDFTFLWALFGMVRHQHMENSAKGLAAYFRERMREEVKPARKKVESKK